MRASSLPLIVATTLGVLAACNAAVDTSGSPPSTGRATTSVAPLPATASGTTLERTTTTAETTTEAAASPPATPDSIDPIDTDASGSASSVRFEAATGITSIGLFGDSLVADLTAIGGRNNQVVPQIAALLVGDAELAVARVENLALPGQSVVADLGVLAPEEATIRPYVEQVLREQPGSIDLALVAISSSDVNLNASLPEPRATTALAEDMLAELTGVESLFDDAGVAVAFLPIFGISDTLFSELRCALATSCPTGPDVEIAAINAFLWERGLPMLFEQFERLDGDGDGRTDADWFENVDPRYPDDGVHMNAQGQELYSTTVYEALRPLLS